MAKYFLRVEKINQDVRPGLQVNEQVVNIVFTKPVFTAKDKRLLIDTLKLAGGEKIEDAPA